AVLPHRLCFVIRTSTEGQVWSVDETTAPPRRLLDLGAGDTLSPFRTIGGTAYFLVRKAGQSLVLWRTGGTPAGPLTVATFSATTPTRPLPAFSQMEAVGGRLFFLLSDNAVQAQVWTNGGTPGIVAPLAGCPGGCPTLASSARLTPLGNRVLFAASDPAHGAELWTSDGT